MENQIENKLKKRIEKKTENKNVNNNEINNEKNANENNNEKSTNENRLEMNSDIKSEVERKAKQIEQVIGKFLPKEEQYQRVVVEAMNYSVCSGGKRLRPMLMMETYRMFGGTETVVEPFMAAIEMIHTYSLIHDDLPAMDNDEYRRGRKTTHIVYGEAMGILAGDALLNYAFETAASAFRPDTNLMRVAKALQILAKKAGIYGMIGGQAVDVQNENNPDIDAHMLEFIYRMKTGALIEASMMAGGVLAGADDQQTAVLERAANQIGVAFQIQDDILDVTGTLEELGKAAGSDEKNKKVTYVSLFGMEAAKKQVEELTMAAIAGINSLPYKNEFLNKLLLYLILRRN